MQQLRAESAPPLPNRTRRSDSIPRRLVVEGKIHLLPLYALLTTSDLAREGIRNSGSFRFADHIYRNEPSGRYIVGRALDRLLLGLKGARSMRSRFIHSRVEIMNALHHIARQTDAAASADREDITIVSAPCGIARDLVLVADGLREGDAALYGRVRFLGIDLDPEPLELSRSLARGHRRFDFICADALDPCALPADADVIVSLGFGEFLTDGQLASFYRNCCIRLAPGGRLITSSMLRHRVSDYLAREMAELVTCYRPAEHLRRLLESAGFANIRIGRDAVGLQNLVVAEKTA